MFDGNKINNVEVKERIPETDINSSAEQQLLYNLTVQSVLANVVRFFAREEEEFIILRVEYDSEKTRYPFEFSFKDKELFLKFFKPL